jgi:ABC-type glycerol-3-phosphate transport system substrate-binding protein
MKRLISTLGFFLFIGVVAVFAQCCNSALADNSTSSEIAYAETQKSGEVKAYYFHGNARCATCEAVEKVSKEAIAEYYGNKVTFESINRDEEKNKTLVTKYKVSGTTLLIDNGEKTVDLTNDAFLNARTKPNKLKSKLKSTIDAMM